MRTYQLTLTPAPGEPAITRTVDGDGLVDVLQSLSAGEIPGDAELSVVRLSRGA